MTLDLWHAHIGHISVETQFSIGWYRHILQLMTTGLHSTTSPSCIQDTFPHSCLVRIVAHLHVLAHLRIPLRIFTFHCASSHSITHLHVSLHIFTFHHASSHFTVHLLVSLCIFTFHCTSSCSIVHLRIPSRIFVFHRNLVRIIAGASIHCPASSLVRRIPFITISVYVWHHTIIISLWTLTLHHLHT